MGQRVLAARIEPRHDAGRAAEGAEGQAAAEILAERGHVRDHAVLALEAGTAEPGRHHLVENQNGAGIVGEPSEAVQKIAVGRYRPAAAGHRLDQDGGNFACTVADRSERLLQIVVNAVDEIERRINALRVGRHVEHPAVIGALEHQDGVAPRVRPRRAEGHHVGLGALSW